MLPGQPRRRRPRSLGRHAPIQLHRDLVLHQDHRAGAPVSTVSATLPMRMRYCHASRAVGAHQDKVEGAFARHHRIADDGSPAAAMVWFPTPRRVKASAVVRISASAWPPSGASWGMHVQESCLRAQGIR